MTSSTEVAILYGGLLDGDPAELRRRNGLAPVSITTPYGTYESTPHRDRQGRPIYALIGTEQSLNHKHHSK
jgi:hypothetical protein